MDSAFKAKAKSVNEKYIVPPKTTDFAIVYAPTESLYKELTEYQDPNTKGCHRILYLQLSFFQYYLVNPPIKNA